MPRANHHRKYAGGLLAAVLGLGGLGLGCVKNVKFTSSQLAQGGKASVRVTLTYDRNNTLQVALTNVPDPSSIKPEYTRYVAWTATPDGRFINVGQLRLDANRNAQIVTLTPLRTFRLVITAEAKGDTLVPGPDKLFESENVNW